MLVVVEQLGLDVVEQAREVDPQDGRAAQVEVGPDPGADLGAHPELLAQLAGERRDVVLAGIDLAAGELPQPGQLRRVGAAAGEHARRVVAQQRGTDDLHEPGHGPHTRAVGAQAAALLDAGGPLGQVEPFVPVGSLRLDVPYDLPGNALLHGGVGLAPTAWDGGRLHLRLPDPVVVAPGLVVSWSGRAPALSVVRRVLGLDDDLSELYDACDRVPSLTGLRVRVVRSPTVWQDLVGTLAGTRASYRSTQAMVRSVAGPSGFPSPEEVLGLDLARWGYRGPWLRSLASRVLDGWDPEQLLSPALSDAEVLTRVRELTGFGPFAAAQLQPLLGRPRPLVLDGWLASVVGDVAAYALMGRWAGTGAWLAATAGRPRSSAPSR